MIHVCEGRRITLNEFVRLVTTNQEPLDDPLQIGIRIFLVLDRLSRSFNHSCDPNVGCKGQILLYAMTLIVPGDQVAFDCAMVLHGPTILYHCEFECRCGSPRWRRRVTSED